MNRPYGYSLDELLQIATERGLVKHYEKREEGVLIKGRYEDRTLGQKDAWQLVNAMLNEAWRMQYAD